MGTPRIYTLLDACEFILEDQGEPQSSYWLASQIMEMKLWRASEADVRDALSKDIAAHGEASLFAKVAEGHAPVVEIIALHRRVIGESDLRQAKRHGVGRVFRRLAHRMVAERRVHVIIRRQLHAWCIPQRVNE